MKVLLVTGSLPPMRCGVGDYTTSLARALADVPGVEVGVLTSKGAILEEPGAIRTFPIISSWGWSEAGVALDLLRTWSPDIVHVQYPTQGYGRGSLPAMIPLIASREGVAVAQTWHELPSPLGVPAFVLNTLIPGPYVIVRPDFRAKLYPALRPLIDRKPGGFIASGSSIPRSTLSEVERVALRKRMSKGKERLIVFFGFLYPFKRVELLFEIADPMRDHLVIAGEQSVDPEYSRSIQSRAETAEWRNSVTMTGFLSETETADLLAAADAVVLPFQHGGGIWNSSIHAALLQGTFVLTTSTTTTGFDEAKNTYFSEVDDMAQMRSALDQYWSQRRAFDPALDGDEWRRIAGEHLKFYRAATLARQSSGRPH